MDYEANFRQRCREVNEAIEEGYRSERIILLHAGGLSWLSTCRLRLGIWWGHRHIWAWKLYVLCAKHVMGWKESA